MIDDVHASDDDDDDDDDDVTNDSVHEYLSSKLSS